MEDNILFMIGNAHIDPVWLWRWQEGYQEIKATFRSALDRMKEDEDFVFVASSAAFYAWVEQNDPAMFAEIRASVADGRWGLVGGWWVEPDCNLPGGESFVRQGLYGQRYFQSRFGRTVRVGYCPDSFGHNAVLPQILKRSGLDFYVFMRPGPHENADLPHLFWWEADDGSRVLTYRIPYAYGTSGPQLEAHIRRSAELLAADPHASMSFYGVGNHGGGPTKENLALIHALGEDASLPLLTMALPEPVFVILSEQRIRLPVVHDELQRHASGCYAAHSGVKRWNRQAEQALVAAEKWSTLATWLNKLPYPAADLERAWKDVLFNQFHDILAGTSIETAYEDARLLYDEARAIAARATNAAVQSLAWQVRIQPEPETLPVVIFNPHAWTSHVPVAVALGGDGGASSVVVDETGKAVPVQLVQPEATVPNISGLSFVAELPALGYRTYRVKKSASAAASAAACRLPRLPEEARASRAKSCWTTRGSAWSSTLRVAACGCSTSAWGPKLSLPRRRARSSSMIRVTRGVTGSCALIVRSARLPWSASGCWSMARSNPWRASRASTVRRGSRRISRCTRPCRRSTSR